MLLNEQRLTEHITAAGLDAIVAAAPENVTYMSGFWALPQWIRRGPQTYVFWPAQEAGAPEIIASTSTLDLIADQQPWVRHVRPYGDFHVEAGFDAAGAVDQRHLALRSLPRHADAITALVTSLQAAGLASGRIGIDEAGFLPGDLQALGTRLPKARLTPASAMLRNVRAVKTADEIERLGAVARIAERSIHASLAAATEGASELDLARAFHRQTVEDGALPVLGCIGFGERSALMNVQPSARKLRPGEIIRFDVGGRFQHYRADIARIACLGEPPAEASRLHRALLRGVERACEVIRPGLRAAMLFEEVMNVVRREGIAHYKRDHVGHGIGLDGYDAPILSASSPETLEEGMVLCVETPYYEIGRWGLQVEDMLVVRERGAERLMTTSGELMMVAQ
ncbi:M24 family metallopeptidase [Mesorhizobium sp. BR1-1-2]|uniref:M24 family metallopeptidase n=1 Tax=Mesorhizobium sp. BR1-1-2 TaxID=2876652 RepID=UPI001CD03C4A|nr:Xaa-Pro peptidase family protein [Mesorhizobium sp. BR1-1-2]MBZ9965896.1 Xaa-Pro peptidase family protein [Mesorhizobium sp. BR1-1-2]